MLDSLRLYATLVHVSFLKRFTIWTLVAEVIQILFIWIYLPISESAIYGTNDDALIASISGGQVTGSPEGHLVFINPLISFPIAWLQMIFGQLNIYTLFLTFSTTISFSLVFGLIVIQNQLSKFNKVVILIFWNLSMVTFISWFALAPTYTGASLFLIGSSVAFALLYLNQNNLDDRARTKFYLSLCLGTFLLAILIRRESFYIFLFFLIIILAPKINYLNVLVKKIVILVSSCLVLILINLGIERTVYNNNEWGEYYKTNSLRHKIQLRSPERMLEDKYTEVGWNKSDLELFYRFILVDKNKMNENSMSKILEVTRENNLDKFFNFFNVSNFVGNTKLAFAAWTWIVMLFAFQFFVILINKITSQRRNEYLTHSFLIFIGVPALFLILNIYYQLPDRISVSIMAACSLFIIALGTDDILNRRKSNKIFIYSQLLILFIFSYLYIQRFQVEFWARSELYKNWISLASQQKQALSNLSKEFIVIGSASSIKSEWQNPYLKFSSLDNRNKTIVLGWHNLSPVWYTNINNYGLDGSNLFLNLLSTDVYWATNKDDILVMQNYLSEGLKSDVPVKDLGPIGYDQYHFFKF